MQANAVLAKAVRLALIAGATSATLSTATVIAAEDSEKVERIEVTGSRIKRTELEGASPITTIDAGNIEKTGVLSVSDLLRQSNLNSFGSFSERSGSSAQSQASINLRGAGSDRTLVLLNGKRMPGSPTLGGTSVNLNTIPTAAIERVEVLSDGASAVYGSDAIAGVVNIILKKDFEGLEFSASTSAPTQDGGEEWKAHIVGGVVGERGNISFSMEHLNREIIFQRDRWYSQATGQDAVKYNDTTGISLFARNFEDEATGKLQPLAACDNPKMVGNGHIFDAGGGDYACGYDYTSVAADHAARSYTAGYVNGEYELTDEVIFQGQGLFARNETFGRFAPAAGSFDVDAGVVDVRNYDENGNFTGITKNAKKGSIYYRFTDVGTRDSETVDYSTDIQLALVGEHDDFSWDVTYHYSLAENNNFGTGYVHRPTVEKYVQDGTFNFGPEGNTADVIADISHNILKRDTMKFHSLNAGVTFEALELPAGMVGWYFGAEALKYDFNADVDAQTAAGDVIGSSGNGSAGTRDVVAAYMESIVPVTDDLEINFALRFDDYNDFGSATTPKLGLRYQLLDDVVVRASWGKGFRAPSLTDLYAADSFSSDSATDFHYCDVIDTSVSDCKAKQYNVTRKANSELEAEKSDFYNVGIIWDITDNLNAKVEYYNLDIDNVIQFISLDALLEQEAVVGYGNLEQGKIVRAGNSPDGKIIEAETPQVNGAALNTAGIDFSINYTGLETSFGEFGTSYDQSYVLKYEEEEFFNGPVVDKIGRNGLPSLRFTWTIDWSMDDHHASLIAKYIHGQYEKTTKGESSGHINSQVTMDFNYNYQTEWDGKVSFGIRNITNEDPVLDSDLNYDSGLYNIYGRTYTTTYTQKF
ncbi:TonB-dependent receptor [Parashewanella spongiae]|uniref:TonB-dependent receptor n=1 Tax=Parashewanella spongiae TaxID=342950 RepID=A0A3A6U608_9GAMM|nr:TonB-dependent receptor [Parashewanella spongiae]MCL1077971.1 TonB-dependent receptor [Parashewanella spongiae]RJY16904.1 TonB-dependent receptor [Parashewanella spongiae]